MYLILLPDNGPKYGLKHVAVIKWSQCKQLDCFVLKYFLCWPLEYHKEKSNDGCSRL